MKSINKLIILNQNFSFIQLTCGISVRHISLLEEGLFSFIFPQLDSDFIPPPSHFLKSNRNSKSYILKMCQTSWSRNLDEWNSKQGHRIRLYTSTSFPWFLYVWSLPFGLLSCDDAMMDYFTEHGVKTNVLSQWSYTLIHSEVNSVTNDMKYDV